MPALKNTLTPFILLLAIALLARAPFAVEPPGRDQSLFMTQADLVLHGERLYLDVWEHKPPGVVFAYALAFALFGRAYPAVQMLAAIALWASSVGVWWLTRRMTENNAAGAAAGALYLVLHASPVFGGFWGAAQPEVLMDPFLVGALIALTPPRGETARGRTGVLLAGAFIGTTVLLKLSALPLLAVFWLTAGAGGLRRRAAGFAWFLGGVAAPWAVYLAHLVFAGGFAPFWDATVRFNLAHRAASASAGWSSLFDHVFYARLQLAPLYVLFFGGALVWLAARLGAGRASIPPGASRLLQMGALLWLLRLAEVFWQKKFWYYHYFVILLPLCLCAGAGLALLQPALRGRWRRSSAWVLPVLVVLALVPHGLALARYSQAHKLGAFWFGGVDRTEFWRTYTWGGTDYDFAETAAAAARVERETSAEDKVFIWGFEPGVYFLSGRAPASRFLYDYPLMPRFAEQHARYTSQLMSDLSENAPRVILVLRRDVNAIESAESWRQLLDVPEFARLLDESYALSWRVGDFHCFRRKSVRADEASSPGP